MFSRALKTVMFVFFALTAVLAVPRAAHAGGTVAAEPAAIDEVDGKWKIRFNIDLGKEPDIQFVTLLFVFEPVVYYERNLTDESPDKPVLNKKALTGQQTINTNEQVPFSDGSGKIYKSTKWALMVKRNNEGGFVAGEYMVTVKKEDGSVLGKPFRITLKGDNPIVDRRAMVFAGTKDDGKKKDDKSKSDGKSGDGVSEPKKTDSGSDGSDSSGSSTQSEGSSTDGQDPPNNAPKKGGCACEVAGSEPLSMKYGALLALGAVGVAMARRGRRREPRRAAPRAQ
ncbi:MAG: hypothetical protein U0271_37440 [Polyangiaceae bacterium]